MNAKWKIAILAMLGLSTAACCGTKKSKKSEDPQPAGVEDQMEDPRIMFMYGVPFPDGEVFRPIEDEATEATKRQEVVTEEGTEAKQEYKEFEDGSAVKPLTDEDAARKLEEVRAEKNQNE